MDENQREHAPRFSCRLYFNENLRPNLKLSSFQRQYHDYIDSKVIPYSFQLAAFIKFNFASEFSFLVPQLNFFHSLARQYISAFQQTYFNFLHKIVRSRKLKFKVKCILQRHNIFSNYKNDKMYCYYEILLICKTI